MERIRSATLFFDDSEEGQRAIEEVRKLEEVGIEVRYWNINNLGGTDFQSPLLYIAHPQWAVPADNLKAIAQTVQSALRFIEA